MEATRQNPAKREADKSTEISTRFWRLSMQKWDDLTWPALFKDGKSNLDFWTTTSSIQPSFSCSVYLLENEKDTITVYFTRQAVNPYLAKCVPYYTKLNYRCLNTGRRQGATLLEVYQVYTTVVVFSFSKPYYFVYSYVSQP